jgi:hypothetical protein
VTRFVVEGEWTGYRPDQRRVVHRSVETVHIAKTCQKIRSIQFTDATSLVLSVRPAGKGERVKEIRAYREMIHECVYYNVDSVDGIEAARKRLRESKGAVA